MATINLAKYTKSKWLRGNDLEADYDGEAIVVTIKNVTEQTFEQTGDTKPVVEFLELDQSLILNKTQTAKLVELFGEDAAAMVGKQITLQSAPSSYPGKATILIGKARKKAVAPVKAEVDFTDDDSEEQVF